MNQAKNLEYRNGRVDIAVEQCGSVVRATCEVAKLSMADGKMVSILLNLNGAYCTMCTRSQAECQKVEVIEEGFLIDRSVESIGQLALSLTDLETGEVIRKRADYKERQGICGQPITESDLTKNIPVCHSKIRVCLLYTSDAADE